MRIATWNVNSLKARLEKVMWWLDRAKPDVLLMQETKLANADAPVEPFRQAGYELAHHGEGRWNGVAIASRCGIDSVIANFGEPLRSARTSEVGDDEPMAEARMVSVECGGLPVICVYAPNGRLVDSPFYEAKLAWFNKLVRWINEDEPNTSHEAPCANSYRWLEENFLKLMKDPICAKNPDYIWGVLQGAVLGKILDIEKISVIEFGVAVD